MQLTALLLLAFVACGAPPHGDRAPVDTALPDYDGDGTPDREDCDDDDPGVYPTAEDPPYDGIDSNCDRWSDFDADRDGDDALAYGGGDCDDANPAQSSLAARVCGNVLDDDCDGESDCDLRGWLELEAVTARTFVATDTDTQAGTSVASGDVNADGVTDLVVGGSESDASWVYLGPLLTGGAPVMLPGGYAGLDVADVDGDGYDDIVTAANYWGPEHPLRVFSGAALPRRKPVVTIAHDDPYEFTWGSAVLAADVNGDGFVDLLQSVNSSVVEVWHGPLAADYAAGEFDASISAPRNDNLDAGDLTGDGVVDVALDAGDGVVSGIYVVEGPISWDVTATEQPIAYCASCDGVLTERAVAVGDVDGDGHDDLLIGAHSTDGQVYMFPGPLAGPLDSATATATLHSGIAYGISLLDIDGDGAQDVAMDASGALPDTPWFSVMLFEAPEGFVEPDAWLVPAQELNKVGSVVGVGDTNGDGPEDLAVGIPFAADEDADIRGGAFLVLGQPSGF